MIGIAGYSYESDESALILGNIQRSEKRDDRGTRSTENVLTIESLVYPSPNNFQNIATELVKIGQTHQLHTSQYEPLRTHLSIGREYQHNLFNRTVWMTAEELHNFLVAEQRLIINCDMDLSKDFILKSFHVLLSGSVYHLCPKIRYSSERVKYTNYSLLREYVDSPVPHPLEPEKLWNGDNRYSYNY